MCASTKSSLVRRKFKLTPHTNHLKNNSMVILPSLGKHKQLYPPVPPLAVLPTTAVYPKKPMRPLPAYHIFFQIEREYIIQTLGGEDADTSIHQDKQVIIDVPSRYKKIKLSLDWYAGPGKREKRKHRKSHGKIGFLELSHQISTRWANLEEIDPETKKFVKDVAESELKEYQREMHEYKNWNKNDVTTSKTASLSLTKESAVRPLPSQHFRRAPQHHHPYKKQVLSHRQQPMRLQSQQKSCRPASESLESVFKLIAADFDDNCAYSSAEMVSDVDFFLSVVEEEEHHQRLMGHNGISADKLSDEMCDEFLNIVARNGVNKHHELSSQGSSSFRSNFDPSSTWPALDCEQPTKKLDASDYADVDDDYIIKLWNS